MKKQLKKPATPFPEPARFPRCDWVYRSKDNTVTKCGARASTLFQIEKWLAHLNKAGVAVMLFRCDEHLVVEAQKIGEYTTDKTKSPPPPRVTAKPKKKTIKARYAG